MGDWFSLLEWKIMLEVYYNVEKLTRDFSYISYNY